MNKVINIDDELHEKLEELQKKYHMSTLSPLISMLLSLGAQIFESFTSAFISIGIQPCDVTPFWNKTYTGITGTSIDVDESWNYEEDQKQYSGVTS